MSISLIKIFRCIKAFFYLKNAILKIKGSAEKLNFRKVFGHYKKVQKHCLSWQKVRFQMLHSHKAAKGGH